MTLKEAVESGRRFKLPSWLCWHKASDGYITSCDGNGASSRSIGLSDAIRTDWEIEPENYEVFAVWRDKKDVFVSSSAMPLDFKGCFNFGDLIGKRTKITIEVLP